MQNNRSVTNPSGRGSCRIINIPHIFTKAVIKLLQQPKLLDCVEFDPKNNFECKFEKNTQFLNLKIKLEGEIQRKIMAVKFNDRQQFSISIARGQLYIKHNDTKVIKSYDIDDLKTTFDFEIFKFNLYQFVKQHEDFIIMLNDRILCQIAMPPPPRSFNLLSGRLNRKSPKSDNPFL